MICSLCRVHETYSGVVHVLGFADSSDGTDAEGRVELNLDTPFQTVVGFLDACHGNVGEGSFDVVEVVLPFTNIGQVVVISADIGFQPTGLKLIAQF